MSEALRPHRVHAQGGSDDQNNKCPDPRCLPRPAALQAEEGGTTPPLRKIMTNLTSVTVSTGDVAFLLLPLALPFPVLPQPQACRLLLWGRHPQLSCRHLTRHHLLLLPLWLRCFCTRKSNRGGLPPWVLCSSLSGSALLCSFPPALSFTLLSP